MFLLPLSFTLDFNECTNDAHLCEHHCYNNVGSYTCDCRIGYRLDDNGYDCHGKTLHMTTQTLLSLSSKISTNASQTMADVKKYVLILMDPISVPVVWVTCWMKIYTVALIMMSVLLMLTTVMRLMGSVTILTGAITVLVRLATGLMLITGLAMVSKETVIFMSSNT